MAIAKRKVWPTLYKKTTRGEVQEWDITVVRDGDNPPAIEIIHGLQDGKKQRATIEVAAGKNAGKKNATTPWEQALSAAESRWKRQQERQGYGTTLDAAVIARASLPMLAQVYDPKKTIDWSSAFTQPKLDGHRCRALLGPDGSVQLVSRKGVPITQLSHIEAAVRPLLAEGVVLDGELYAHGMHRQQIASAVVRKNDRAEHAEAVQLHLYDLVSPDRFQVRYEQLRQLVKNRGSDPVLLVPTVRIASAEDLAVCEREYLESGYEGGILRHGRAGYESGKRTSALLKLKTFVDADFQVVDVNRVTTGNHAGCALFICQTPAGHDFTVEAPGTLEQKRAYWNTAADWVGRNLVVKFAYYSQGDRPVPVQPVALAVRAPGE